MPSHIVQDAIVFAGGYNISGDLNAVALTASADLKDFTTLGKAGRVRKSGIRSAVMQMEGFWSGDTTDPLTAVHFGLENVPITVAIAPAENAVAYMFRAIEGEYEWGGPIGEPSKFSAGAQSSAGDPLVRGALLQIAPVTGSGTGTPRQVGAVSATQRVYASLHVTSLTGLLDVRVQSDDLVGFASPTLRLTFAQATLANTSQWLSLVGPITDTFWRVDWTATGTATFTVALGIL